MVKSTPTPIIIEESRAVAPSMAIPENPMNPKRIIPEIASGIVPTSPPLNDRKTIANRRNTVRRANRIEYIWPLKVDNAKSAMINA